jgi:hypothetical protein
MHNLAIAFLLSSNVYTLETNIQVQEWVWLFVKITKPRNLSQLFQIIQSIEDFWFSTATLP